MEDWEKELREKLDKEIPDGLYELGNVGDPWYILTGKGGKINFEVELMRHIKDLKHGDNKN